MHDTIDFKSIASAALACARSLLPQLVPDGRFEGDEYVALNPSRADKNLGSFQINSKTGKWSDFATGAKGGDFISRYAHASGFGQSEAARRIAEKGGHIVAAQAQRLDRTDYETAPEIIPVWRRGAAGRTQ